MTSCVNEGSHVGFFHVFLVLKIHIYAFGRFFTQSDSLKSVFDLSGNWTHDLQEGSKAFLVEHLMLNIGVNPFEDPNPTWSWLFPIVHCSFKHDRSEQSALGRALPLPLALLGSIRARFPYDGPVPLPANAQIPIAQTSGVSGPPGKSSRWTEPPTGPQEEEGNLV